MSIILKLVKYIIIFISFSGISISYKLAFYIITNQGYNNHILPLIILPVNLFLIFKIIIKKGVIVSLAFTGGILLFLFSYRLEVLKYIDLKYSHLTGKGVIDFIAYITSIVILIFLIVCFFKKKNKSIGKTKKNPYRLIFRSKKRTVYIDNPFRGIYLQGGAGSGKSETWIKPIIKQIVELNYAGILYDFKSPELSEEYFSRNLKITHKNPQVKPYLIDFKNPLISKRVNPLNPNNLLKSAFAFEYSEAIMTNLNPLTIEKKEWYDRDALSILTALIWFMRNNHPKYCTLPHIVSLILHTDVEVLLNEITKDTEASGMISSIKQALERNAEKQVSAVISTLQNLLARINNADVFWVLSGDDFSLDINNPNEPKFLCIGNDSTLPTTFTPVISLIITVATRLMNTPNKHHSMIVLDEAPTIYIPNFEKIPATARSNKIATVYATQDYSQVIDALGETKGQVILSNLGNQFFGRTSNSKTAEIIKALFSKKDVTYIARGNNKGTSGEFIHLGSSKGRSTSESIQERDRVKISDIINMRPGEFYGIIAEGKPKEFLKEQFNQNKSEKMTHEFEEFTTYNQIKINYIKIVNEAKSLFGKPINQRDNIRNASFDI